MTDPLLDYATWVSHMRLAICAASIVHQCHDKMNRGLGAPDVEDMKRYAEEAGGIADLWEETLPP